MEALFIGHHYIDVTFLTDEIPTGDNKTKAKDYAFGVGGNAVVSCFTASKLGLKCGLITQLSDDTLDTYFKQRADEEGIQLFTRNVKRGSLALVLPNNGNKRAILACRDNDYLSPAPEVSLDGVKIVHVDGRMPATALKYVKEARAKGITTSLDGGTVRPHIEEIIDYIDIAVVSEDFAAEMEMSTEEMIQYLLNKGVKLAAVTLGDKGVYYSEGDEIKHIEALNIPSERIIDTTGAGDIFHGTYVASVMNNPNKTWEEHLKYSTCASALCIQKIGTEAGIPEKDELEDLYKSL